VIDGPLGHLSRWLRLMGYDCIYSANKSGNQIINEVKQSHRTVITKSLATFEVLTKLGLSSILVKESKIEDLLSELYKQGLKIENPDIQNSRCSKCNGKLRQCSEDERRNGVPNISKETFDDFFICTECEHIFWEGSHWIKIRELIKSVIMD
jgi:hypothetical protein